MQDQPIIIPAIFGMTEIETLALPKADRNLFGRIIRNPQPTDRSPKERECTEMLCAVLLNTEQLRNAILVWLGGLVGQFPTWNRLKLTIDTEQLVEGKRDDLRIEGHDIVHGTKVLLWSIEVKVGAGFHQSSTLDPGPVKESVHQVANYDFWLARQNISYCAGFVLARHETTANLPRGLRVPWGCSTWTQLGQIIEPLLAGNTLSGTEAFLARHLLGFIRNHFWEVTMETNTRIDFDDISLLRAYSAIGNRTVLRVNSILEPLARVMADADAAVGSPVVSKKILQGQHRTVVYQSLVDPNNSRPPYLFAGLTTDSGINVTVSLETSPNYSHKQALHRMLEERLSALTERNPFWKIIDLEERPWRDLELAVSVESLLVVEDQVDWIRDFVAKAIADLKVTGVIEGARRIGQDAQVA